MATTVHVPLAVARSGRLPPVCVCTGEPAAGYVPLAVGRRLGPAWLLLVAGPLGVVAIAAIWARRRGRDVVRLPMSVATFEQLHLLWRRRLWCSWLGGVGFFVSFALWWMPVLAVAALGASTFGLVVALRAHLAEPWHRPSAVVDAGGRRVTLAGVHPGFAAALAGSRPPAR